jgi:type VI secretion system secreted protein VgrG
MATIRHVTVTTPLDDELFLLSMHGNESLSRPFQFDLELLGETSLIESAALLGEHITVHLEIAGHAVRHFNGVVTRFAYAGAHGRFFLYRLTMRPWLWLLDHVAQNDIYQRLSIPELAHLVFRLNGFTDVNPDDLTGSYSEREYVVQYHESAFNFVTRWLEHEGIYYYFEHDETSHKICLADTSSKGATVKSYDKLPFRTASQAAREARDHFTQWHQGARVAPESYALDAFDYLKPKNDLLFNTPTPDRSAMGSDADFGSIIDANQNYVDPKIGEAYSRTRAEELRSSQELFEGSGNVRGLRPGALFELTDHPRKSLNRKYCVVGVYYSIQAGEFESDETRAEYQVHTNVQAIDANVHYRPPRTTRAPTVVGPETATVVGAS